MQQTLFGQVIATFGRHLLVRDRRRQRAQGAPLRPRADGGVRRRGALPRRRAPRGAARAGGAAAPHGAVALQPARRGRAGGRQSDPPAGGARAAAGAGPVRGRPLPGGRRLRRHRRHAHRQQERPRAWRPRLPPSSTAYAAAGYGWHAVLGRVRRRARRAARGCCAGNGRGAGRTVGRRQVLAGAAAAARRAASRSARWCARRKAGTRPRRRGASSCRDGARAHRLARGARLRAGGRALDARTLGFIEVERLAPGCRFTDCRHMREPGCAVRAAAESGALARAPLRELPAPAAAARRADRRARAEARRR